MATQYIDGIFGETKPMAEALKELHNAIDAGTAKAFHIGSPEEIEAVKDQAGIHEQLDSLKNRLADIEAEKSEIILKPSLAEVERFSL